MLQVTTVLKRGENHCYCKRKPKVGHYLYLVECTLATLYALLHAMYFPPQLFYFY